MHRNDTPYAQRCLTAAAAFGASLASARECPRQAREDRQMLKTLALAFTTLLIDRFDWFVIGVTLTCAALVVCLYW